MEVASIRILSLIASYLSDGDLSSLRSTCLSLHERCKHLDSTWIGIDVGEKSTAIIGVDALQRVCLSAEQLHVDDKELTGDYVFDLVAFVKDALPFNHRSHSTFIEIECQPAHDMQKMSHAILATLYSIGWPRGSVRLSSATNKMSIEPSKQFLKITEEDVAKYEGLSKKNADRLKNKMMAVMNAYAAMTWVGDQTEYINLKIREARKEQIHDWCDGYLFALARCWKDTECRILDMLKERLRKKRRKEIPSGRFTVKKTTK